MGIAADLRMPPLAPGCHGLLLEKQSHHTEDCSVWSLPASLYKSTIRLDTDLSPQAPQS